ncbi:14625_t:CDS:2, partial [Acaulospora morrowiae]
WAEEAPAAVSCLKIVYRGRLLDDDTTLESNKIPRGQSTVVHLAIKNIHKIRHQSVNVQYCDPINDMNLLHFSDSLPII